MRPVAEAGAAGATFVVAQMGARRHYAVARILSQAGRLARLYTDYSAADAVSARLARLLPPSARPAAVRRLLGRVPAGIPAERVSTCERVALSYALSRALSARSTTYRPLDIAAHRRFGAWVARRGLDGARAVYAFHTAALEVFAAARAHGAFTVLEQEMLPFARDVSVVSEEAALHPGWERFAVPPEWVRSVSERERAEWALADLIVCPSAHVKEWVGRSGGPEDRCTVLPYGVDAPSVARAARGFADGLRVLTAGAVGLRKGTPYVMQAAARLRGEAEFRVVGHSTLEPRVMDELRTTLELRGPVPRREMPLQYAWADVFLLPSLSEGSATVCYEALAAGLPVVTTAETGSVVRDGVDGFIVPARDVDAIVDRLLRLRRDPGLLAGMSARALERAAEFTLARYGERLWRALGLGA